MYISTLDQDILSRFLPLKLWKFKEEGALSDTTPHMGVKGYKLREIIPQLQGMTPPGLKTLKKLI